MKNLKPIYGAFILEASSQELGSANSELCLEFILCMKNPVLLPATINYSLRTHFLS